MAPHTSYTMSLSLSLALHVGLSNLERSLPQHVNLSLIIYFHTDSLSQPTSYSLISQFLSQQLQTQHFSTLENMIVVCNDLLLKQYPSIIQTCTTASKLKPLADNASVKVSLSTSR